MNNVNCDNNVFCLPPQTFPFFGVQPELLDEDGHVIEGEGEGYLVFRRPWPGMMRTLYGNHERFQSTYFDRFHGFYCTGDGNLLLFKKKLNHKSQKYIKIHLGY